MERLDNNYYLIIAGFIAIGIEILLGVATGFDLLLIGIIAIISGMLGLFFHSFSTALVLIAILSFIYIVFGRRFVKNQLAIETKKTNVDSIIGSKGIVIKPIESHHPGQVKVEGEIWRAESATDLKIGQEVKIQSVSGVTLKVIKE